MPLLATERLYYTDSHLTAFDAEVVEAGMLDGRPWVVLDRTAFYPTSGGQPFDTGSLGPYRVVEVIDRDEDGAVVHVLSADNQPPLPAGLAVRGVVDWQRRFDHMQQHTGQHVLSAAFVRVLEIPTVSFHLGAELATIDLAGSPDAADIARAESEANRVVWEDRPVLVRFVTGEEAARLPLRKAPVRGGTLRVVDVEGFDLSACGGTHVTRTGAVGLIAVRAWERYKGGTRVTFACGGRALAQFRVHRDAASAAARALSVNPAELPDAIERLLAELKDTRLRASRLGEALAGFEADALAREAAAVAGGQLVCRIVEGRDGQALKTLAQAVAGRPGHIAVLVGATRPALVVVARAADAPGDAAAVVKALVARFGGRGGGRPETAQAGGLDADPSEVCSAARSLLPAG